MEKIRLVYPNIRPQAKGFRNYYLKDFFTQYFDLELYDPDKTYHPKDTIFVKRLIQGKPWWPKYEALKQEGFKVLLDHVEECPDQPLIEERPFPGDYVLYCEKWFWYAESLWYRYFDYHLYQPQRNFKYKGLMPINKEREWRRKLIQQLGQRLDDFIWSYGDRHLPNDLRDDKLLTFQRYFNPEWYDSTYFSLVVETLNEGTGFITEKTFKPCAYRHPFMVVGQMHTLALLRQWGFETFGNLWDESYDEIESYQLRRERIMHNINRIKPGPYDQLTEQKLAHNHARFFDIDLVHQGLKKDVVDRIIEIIETR